MRPVVANLLLALAWVGVTGGFSLANLAFGFAIGFAILASAADVMNTHAYRRRALATLVLIGVLAWELIVSNFQVAFEVATPRLKVQPGIVGIDLAVQGDWELLILALLITLTPGSVVVRVTPDRARMYVYGMYVRDPQEFARRLKNLFEPRVLAVTREKEQT